MTMQINNPFGYNAFYANHTDSCNCGNCNNHADDPFAALRGLAMKKDFGVKYKEAVKKEEQRIQDHKDRVAANVKYHEFKGETADDAFKWLDEKFGPLYHSKDTFHCNKHGARILEPNTMSAIMLFVEGNIEQKHRIDWKRKVEGKVKYVLCQHQLDENVRKIWQMLDDIDDEMPKKGKMIVNKVGKGLQFAGAALQFIPGVGTAVGAVVAGIGTVAVATTGQKGVDWAGVASGAAQIKSGAADIKSEGGIDLSGVKDILKDVNIKDALKNVNLKDVLKDVNVKDLFKNVDLKKLGIKGVGDLKDIDVKNLLEKLGDQIPKDDVEKMIKGLLSGSKEVKAAAAEEVIKKAADTDTKPPKKNVLTAAFGDGSMTGIILLVIASIAMLFLIVKFAKP